MPRLRRASGAETISALEGLGFVRVRQRGSHVVLKKQTPAGEVGCVVPLHRELALGTLRGILRQARVTIEDFLAPTCPDSVGHPGPRPPHFFLAWQLASTPHSAFWPTPRPEPARARPGAPALGPHLGLFPPPAVEGPPAVGLQLRSPIKSS
jgi:predicted RNA binding protein YcfA (HicA-like mRNA interferase family)